jgi:hypothetical protein
MKKSIILILLFVVLNASANSNWVSVSVGVSGHESFIDKNSIQKSGDSVTFWLRRNNKARDEQGVLSWKVQQTINCRSRENIYRYYMNFDDLDNNGKTLMNSAPIDPRWIPIPPDSVMWALYEFVCK